MYSMLNSFCYDDTKGTKGVSNTCHAYHLYSQAVQFYVHKCLLKSDVCLDQRRHAEWKRNWR